MRYMAIEREYGSGGTLIANRAAELCGVPCYGKEILELSSEKLQMPIEEILDNEEKSTGSILYGIYMLSQSISADSDMLTTRGKIYVEEHRIIKNLAKQGDAIFLGHCAAEALKDFQDVISVFIYADTDTKKERIRKDYGIPEMQIASEAVKNNRRRSNYYTINTQKKWDDYRNYDIVLDSSRLGIERCAQILASVFR